MIPCSLLIWNSQFMKKRSCRRANSWPKIEGNSPIHLPFHSTEVKSSWNLIMRSHSHRNGNVATSNQWTSNQLTWQVLEGRSEQLSPQKINSLHNALVDLISPASANLKPRLTSLLLRKWSIQMKKTPNNSTSAYSGKLTTRQEDFVLPRSTRILSNWSSSQMHHLPTTRTCLHKLALLSLSQIGITKPTYSTGPLLSAKESREASSPLNSTPWLTVLIKEWLSRQQSKRSSTNPSHWSSVPTQNLFTTAWLNLEPRMKRG